MADGVERIYEKVDFPKREVAKVVEYVFDIMKETFQCEEKLMISGFGNFLIRNKRPGEVEIRRREVISKSLREEF